ncbi:hypothetical protein JCM3775_003186 [Rhodotorula graminis]
MVACAVLAILFVVLGHAAPLPGDIKGLATSVKVDSATSAALAEVSAKELCYLEFVYEADAAATRFTKDQLIKDSKSRSSDGKTVLLNDGYKEDSTGREVYYLSYCYASSSVKGSTSESKKGDSTTTTNPFADIIEGLGIQSGAGFGGSGGILESLVGGGGGAGKASGLLRKRQLLGDGFGGGLGGSSPLGGSSFGTSPLGGSPFSSSPLSSSPLDVIDGGSPAGNFDATNAIQGIGKGGSSDALAGQSGLLDGERGSGPTFGNLGEGRGGGGIQGGGDDSTRPTSGPENKPTGFHIRQSSIDESILHSDSRKTNTVPSRLASAAAATRTSSPSSFVPVELAKSGGPTIAVAVASQPPIPLSSDGPSQAQQFSIQTIQPTPVS